MFATYPTISGLPGESTNSAYPRLYNNSQFDYLSESLPKDIKDMFKWCELVYMNSPNVAHAIRKYVNYPITDFVPESSSAKVKDQTLELLDNIGMREHLLNLGLDYMIYGNAFRNVYFPFLRMFRCNLCGAEHAATSASQMKWISKKMNGICPACKRKVSFTIKDEETGDKDNVVLVHWDPKCVSLLRNQISNKSVYYYSLPEHIRTSVLSCEPVIINSLPEVFINASINGKRVEFGGNFYHFKAPAISGFGSGWGIPFLAQTFKLYLYTSVLRKASESIGLEHITPKNILYPERVTNDPTQMTSMLQWRTEMKKALQAWRRDPNFVMLAPYPTGVANIGSQGRNLIPTQEIRYADETMIRALDIPQDLVFNSGNAQLSPVSLRLLENQLVPYTRQITSYVNWVIDMINAKYDSHFCHVSFSKFTLADDVLQKQLLLSASAGSGVSKRTVLEALNLDPDKEEKNMVQDEIAAYRIRKEIEEEQRLLESNLAAQAKEDVATAPGSIPSYNQQQMVQSADSYAQQLIAVPYEERKSYLASLQNEDYVMWALVSKRLEALHDAQKKNPAQQQ